jgi:hypothetical protein
MSGLIQKSLHLVLPGKDLRRCSRMVSCYDIYQHQDRLTFAIGGRQTSLAHARMLASCFWPQTFGWMSQCHGFFTQPELAFRAVCEYVLS